MCGIVGMIGQVGTKIIHGQYGTRHRLLYGLVVREGND